MALLEAMVRKTPKSTDMLGAACWVRGTLNQQLDTALAECDEALRIAPKGSWNLSTRCFVRYRTGEFALAITDCDESLREYPKSAHALYVRGLAKHKTGDTPGGDADIAAAKAIDPKIAETYVDYGVTP